MNPIEWTLGFPMATTSGAFGKNLHTDRARITSTDGSVSGPNPSQITISSVNNADDGATAICRLLNVTGMAEEVHGTVYAPP